MPIGDNPKQLSHILCYNFLLVPRRQQPLMLCRGDLPAERGDSMFFFSPMGVSSFAFCA